jgi:pilus assembly protein Flp/PilA
MTKFNALIQQIKSVAQDEEGISAVEYGVLGALMVAAIVAGMLILGPQLTATFTSIANSMKG